MARQCDLIVGYLLPRQCEERAANSCGNCGRAACELHTRMGDQGLLCRDCYEEGKPRAAGAPEPLAEPVQQIIYQRDFDYFDDDMSDDGFASLS
jgi:hypothetical protein